MADYRLSHVDWSTRMELALVMLNPARPWGLVSELARQYQVSRKFLYELKWRAEQGIAAELQPREAGRPATSEPLTVDSTFLEWAMLVLATAVPGSVRGIQLALELLFGKHRALGLISETLQAAGEAAQAYNVELALPVTVLGEADEIFQGGQPCLTVVDGHSFLALNLSAEDNRDATTWGTTFLDLQERGVQFQDLVSDGARGIRAGATEAGLTGPLRPDLFHLLRDGQRITRRLEAQAYRALETAARARRAQAEAQAPKRRRGRRLQVQVSLAEAEAQEKQALEHSDWWVWLFGELRHALQPFNAQGELMSAQQARAIAGRTDAR